MKYIGPALLAISIFGTGFVVGCRNQRAWNEARTTEPQPLDESVSKVALRFDKGEAVVIYEDGNARRADAIGAALVTLGDHEKFPDRFERHGIKLARTDYPVVAFFNATAFDATGDPLVVRRASDGKELYRKDSAGKQVAAVIARRGGGFRWLNAYHWDTGEKVKWADVTDEEWFKDFMNLEPPVKIPPAEELEKMTDEELKKLGVNRMERAEYEKKFGKLPATPEATVGKTGIRGRVVPIGNAKIPAGSKILIWKGKVKPSDKLLESSETVMVIDFDKDGSYAATLLPGTYTVTVKWDGKLYGNSLDQSAWPSVEVKDAWVEYDIRLQAR